MTASPWVINELAIRAIIPDIAAENTLLRKTSQTGGREYEEVSLGDGLAWEGTELIAAYTGWPRVPGFLDIIFDNTNREFYLDDAGGGYYYIKGVRYDLGGFKTVNIDDTEGEWYIYFDGADLVASQTPWDILDDDKAFVSVLYWDKSAQACTYMAWEAHTIQRKSAVWHWYLHHTRGCAFREGLLVSNAGSNLINVQAGRLADEDIDINITDGAGGTLFEQVLSPAEIPIQYRDGATDWARYDIDDKVAATDIGYVTGNKLCYNRSNAGVYNVQACSNNYYIAMWVVGCNDRTYPVQLIMGQRQDNTLALARTNNSFANLSLTGLPFAEMKPLARIILRQSGTSYTLTEINDLRASNEQGNVLTPTVFSHSTLANLDNADHPFGAVYTTTANRLLGGKTADAACEELALSSGAGLTFDWTVAGGVGIGLITDTPRFARLGLGNVASATVPLYIESAHAADATAFLFNGPYDTYIRFGITGRSYALGVDNSDADKFVLATSASYDQASPGTGNLLTVTTAGILTATASVVATGFTATTGGLYSGGNSVADSWYIGYADATTAVMQFYNVGGVYQTVQTWNDSGNSIFAGRVGFADGSIGAYSLYFTSAGTANGWYYDSGWSFGAGGARVINLSSSGLLLDQHSGAATSLLGLTSGEIVTNSVTGVAAQLARLGLGAVADATAILYTTTAHATSPSAWFNQSDAGDSYTRYSLAASRSYAWGIDNSDADKMVLSTAASGTAVPGTTNLFTITTAGAGTFASTLQATAIHVEDLTTNNALRFANNSGERGFQIYVTAVSLWNDVLTHNGTRWLTPSVFQAANLIISDAGTIGSVSDTDAITITAAGDIGLGGISPTTRVHIYHATDNCALRIETDGESKVTSLRLECVTAWWLMQNNEADSNKLIFKNSANDPAVYFDTAGQIYADLGAGDGHATVFDDYDDPRELSNILQKMDLDRGVDMGVLAKDKTTGRYSMNVTAFAKLLAGACYQLDARLKAAGI